MPGCSLVLVCHVSVARDNQLDRAAGGRPQHSIEAFAERRAPIHLNDLASPFSTLPLSRLSCRMILSMDVSPLSMNSIPEPASRPDTPVDFPPALATATCT